MKAIETLEKTKKAIQLAIEDYLDELPDESPVNYEEYDPFYKESRLIIKRLAREMEKEVPYYINDCRTVEEVVDKLSLEMEFNGNHSYLIKNNVTTTFNMFIDYLEESSIDVQIIHVPCEIPDHLTFSTIKHDLQNCEKRFNDGDYSGAITSAKTLVEGVCHEILLNITGDSLADKPKLPVLFKKVRENLNLNPDNPKYEKSLKEIISGLNSIVNGLSEVRNQTGDAHHRTYIVDKHHALVVINSAKTLVTFLFHTYEYQLKNGTLTKGVKA